MSDFNLITTRIIPKFLEKTKYKYVVLGGKAYQYYFKDIRSDDWDIILDYDPNKFLEELMNELNKYGIFDIELSMAKDIIGEKVFQMGLKSYKGADYEDRFFIDIKQGKIKLYKPIIFSGIVIASLEYLYKDGLKTLSDREKNFKEINALITQPVIIKNKIEYFKGTIKLNIRSNFNIILNFYKTILTTFKDGSELKEILETFLDTFINYYNDSINKNTISSIKINEELEDNYEQLYNDILYKYHQDIETLKGKKLELYKLISALEEFIYEIKQYKNRKSIIDSYKSSLKEQTIIIDRIKTKYLKSFRRIQAFMTIIAYTDTSISIFTKKFINYIKSKCKTNVFVIHLGKDKEITIPCKKYSRRYSNSKIMNKKGMKKTSRKLKRFTKSE
jgi:hypothetical protein